MVAVYDYENKIQQLYINGVAVGAGTAISGEFVPAGDEAYNLFCLGADYRAQANVGQYTLDYPCPNMTMVDAKIYSQALTAEQAAAAYEAALASLS